MQIEDSKLLLRAAFEASSILSVAVSTLRQGLDEPEDKALALSVGYVLAEINERLLKPVFAEHAALRPDSHTESWVRLRDSVGASDWSSWPRSSDQTIPTPSRS